MRLPNKITSYHESVISYFPLILDIVRSEDITPLELSQKTKKYMSVSELTEALDCLYALGKISLSEDGRMLQYVI